MLYCCTLTEQELFDKNEHIELLISRLAKDDISAMDKLYALIKTDVYAFALAKTKHPEDAEDIMQDTFVQIYKYACRYVPQKKPMAWIFTIETNLANRKFQLSQRTTELDEDFENTAEVPGFEDDVIHSEFIRQLMQILSKEEQEIIVLHIVSGLKHSEIAAILDKPLSTVLSRYNRAIKKMQKYEREAR